MAASQSEQTSAFLGAAHVPASSHRSRQGGTEVPWRHFCSGGGGSSLFEVLIYLTYGGCGLPFVPSTGGERTDFRLLNTASRRAATLQARLAILEEMSKKRDLVPKVEKAPVEMFWRVRGFVLPFAEYLCTKYVPTILYVSN